MIVLKRELAPSFRMRILLFRQIIRRNLRFFLHSFAIDRAMDASSFSQLWAIRRSSILQCSNSPSVEISADAARAGTRTYRQSSRGRDRIGPSSSAFGMERTGNFRCSILPSSSNSSTGCPAWSLNVMVQVAPARYRSRCDELKTRADSSRISPPFTSNSCLSSATISPTLP